MIGSTKRLLLGALLLLAPMFTACEQAQDITSIETTDATFAAKHKKTARVVSANVTESGVVEGFARPGRDLTLRLGQYRLIVPKNAVLARTKFRMTVLSGHSVKVSLEAWDAATGIEISRFRKGLFITLPYSAIDPTFLDDESDLVVANVSEDGGHKVLEIVDTNVDNNAQTVTGKITHFSMWAVAREIIVGID